MSFGHQVSRSRTGIRGLDELTGAALQGRPTLVCGGRACGKTLLGIEFLIHGALLHAEPEQSGDFALEGLFIRRGHSIARIGARRVVLDTIESMFATWLPVRDMEIGGERNRGLDVLKSRGMQHSNQPGHGAEPPGRDGMNAPRDAWVPRLFVAGQSPRFLRALANGRRIGRDQLPGRHDLEVIDLHQQPEPAQEAQIVALPTLIKKSLVRTRMLIGDLSNAQDVRRELDLPLA